MISLPVTYSLCLVLFFIGLYGIVTKKNAVKIIISIIIMENSVNLFLLLVGYRKDGIAPIMTEGMSVEKFVSGAVDPLTQAMVLTSIVIGLSVVALMVAIAIRIYERFNTFDVSEIKDLKG
ncbi:MAG: cation:proton antiporter subunit C [Elusimicrobia bacterium]|jgi:multicomponent Na+:H+ antiporter subunit C|nr:cation:proton antiporter subunit C [Elusimicrobiota bacterium]